MSPGIEETVALALYSPPASRGNAKSAQLITAIGDYSGFVHWDLDKPAPGGNPKPPFLGNTHDVSGGALKPERDRPRRSRAQGRESRLLAGRREDLARTDVGSRIPRRPPGASPSPPTAAPGSGRREGHVPFVTSDNGATWTACAGVPKETTVVADRVNPKRFYGIALFDGKLFESIDGAAHFTEQPLILPGGLPKRGGSGDDNRTNRGDDRGGQDQIYATPEREGDLWLAAYDGLYHSPATARRSADSFAFRRRADPRLRLWQGGAARAKKEEPGAALYLVGTVQGQRGFFRSTDGGPPGRASTTISTSGG